MRNQRKLLTNSKRIDNGTGDVTYYMERVFIGSKYSMTVAVVEHVKLYHRGQVAQALWDARKQLRKLRDGAIQRELESSPEGRVH